MWCESKTPANTTYHQHRPPWCFLSKRKHISTPMINWRTSMLKYFLSNYWTSLKSLQDDFLDYQHGQNADVNLAKNVDFWVIFDLQVLFLACSEKYNSYIVPSDSSLKKKQFILRICFKCKHATSCPTPPPHNNSYFLRVVGVVKFPNKWVQVMIDTLSIGPLGTVL